MANAGADGTIRRLVGVYDADGTALGELKYFIAARFGRAHCALCDITHATVREKAAWRTARGQLTVAFDTYHRDDQPDALRRTYDAPPIIAAETDSGFHVLVEAEGIAACHGSVEALLDAVRRAVSRSTLAWPA